MSEQFPDPQYAYPEIVMEFVEDYVTRRAVAEEQFCEMSLTDPEQRGVLITETTATSYSIELSKEVPYGQITVRQEWR